MQLPFTYRWIIRRAIGKNPKTILDLGCGKGDFMGGLFYGKKPKITGVDLFKDDLAQAEKSGVYTKLVNADVVKLPKSVTKGKYDIVFSSQVLEHLSRKKALEALSVWETLYTKRIVVTTTNGFLKYEPIEPRSEEINPFQKHLSGWKSREFEKRGYRVVGQGIKFIYGKKGLARRFPNFIVFLGLISLLFSPLVYFIPEWGTYLITWKEK